MKYNKVVYSVTLQEEDCM